MPKTEPECRSIDLRLGLMIDIENVRISQLFSNPNGGCKIGQLLDYGAKSLMRGVAALMMRDV